MSATAAAAAAVLGTRAAVKTAGVGSAAANGTGAVARSSSAGVAAVAAAPGAHHHQQQQFTLQQPRQDISNRTQALLHHLQALCGVVWPRGGDALAYAKRGLANRMLEAAAVPDGAAFSAANVCLQRGTNAGTMFLQEWQSRQQQLGLLPSVAAPAPPLKRVVLDDPVFEASWAESTEMFVTLRPLRLLEGALNSGKACVERFERPLIKGQGFLHPPGGSVAWAACGEGITRGMLQGWLRMCVHGCLACHGSGMPAPASPACERTI